MKFPEGRKQEGAEPSGIAVNARGLAVSLCPLLQPYLKNYNNAKESELGTLLLQVNAEVMG